MSGLVFLQLKHPVFIYGVVTVHKPVADIDIYTVRQAVLLNERSVAVSKNAVVKVFLFQSLLAVENNPFASIPSVFKYLWILFDVALATVVAPAVGDAKGES